VELVILASDQAAEQEAAGGSGDEQVAVERACERFGLQPLQPELVAAAIIADPGLDDHRDQPGRSGRRQDDAVAARRVGALMVERRGDRNVHARGQGDEIGRLDLERLGDPVQPPDRDRPRARLEPADRLRGRRRPTARGDVLERHPARAPHLPKTGDHLCLLTDLALHPHMFSPNWQ